MPDPLSQFHFSLGVTAFGCWPGKPLYIGINTLEISFPKNVFLWNALRLAAERRISWPAVKVRSRTKWTLNFLLMSQQRDFD